MADEVKQAWGDVGDKFASLGKRLADRYRESGGGEPAAAAETKHKLEEVARELAAQLERAVDALDATVRDEEARKDLKGAASAMGSAISLTVNQAADAVRHKSDAADAPEPPRPDDGEPAAGSTSRST